MEAGWYGVQIYPVFLIKFDFIDRELIYAYILIYRFYELGAIIKQVFVLAENRDFAVRIDLSDIGGGFVAADQGVPGAVLAAAAAHRLLP